MNTKCISTLYRWFRCLWLWSSYLIFARVILIIIKGLNSKSGIKRERERELEWWSLGLARSRTISGSGYRFIFVLFHSFINISWTVTAFDCFFHIGVLIKLLLFQIHLRAIRKQGAFNVFTYSFFEILTMRLNLFFTFNLVA